MKYRHKGSSYDRPTDELYLVAVVSRTECHAHNARFGEPCFQAVNSRPYLTKGSGICNKRATEAGFKGKINPASLSRTQKK